MASGIVSIRFPRMETCDDTRDGGGDGMDTYDLVTGFERYFAPTSRITPEVKLLRLTNVGARDAART